MMKFFKRLGRHCVVYGMMPLFNHAGRRFYLSYRPDNASLRDHAQWKEITRIWEHGQRGNNRGDWTRLFFLLDSIENLKKRGIAGSVAELGVFKGTTAKIMHMLLPDRDFYLFDTFEGFDARDTAEDPAKAEPGSYFGSLDEVKAFLGEDDKLHYCPGFFPETAKMAPDGETYALVHLDCDLYEPMKAGCEYFYDRIAPGGLLIIHDYHSGCWEGVTRAIDEFFADKPEKPVLIPDKSGTAVVVKSDAKALQKAA